jgi:hypothetical protein
MLFTRRDLDSENIGSQPSSFDAASDLRKSNVSRRRCVVCKRREPTVVRGSERFGGNEFGRFEYSTADFFGRFKSLLDGVDNPNEETGTRAQKFLCRAKHASTVGFTRQLDIETSGIQAE